MAGRWGFHDSARFTRLCRQRFGCLPSDILVLAAPAQPEAARASVRRSPEVAVPSLRSLYD